MASHPDVDGDLILFRIGARALAKRLAREAAAGELVCEVCASPLVFEDAQARLLDCGHEVIAVPCPTPRCPSGPGQVFEPRGIGGHTAADTGVALPLAAWLRL